MIISNIQEMKTYYNKYDTSVYLVEPQKKTIYSDGSQMPSFVEFTQSGYNIQEHTQATEEGFLNTIYFERISKSQELFLTTDFAITQNSFLLENKANISLDEKFLDFILIKTTSGDILIQPSFLKLSISENTAEIGIVDLLPLAAIDVQSIEVWKMDYVYPESVSANMIVTLDRKVGQVYRLNNICYNNYIIMNSYGIPIDRTNIYTNGLDNFNAISESKGILSYTQTDYWLELNGDIKIISKYNKIKTLISETDPSGMIISKNGQTYRNSRNLPKNRYTYIPYPLANIQTTEQMYQYQIRDDYYSNVEKIILRTQYNITDKISDIQVSDEYDKRDNFAKLNTTNKTVVSKSHDVQIDLLEDFYADLDDKPKKIFIIDEKYFPYE